MPGLPDVFPSWPSPKDKLPVRKTPDPKERQQLMEQDSDFAADVKNDMQGSFLDTVMPLRPQLGAAEILNSDLGRYVSESLKRGYEQGCPYEIVKTDSGFKLIGTVPPELPTLEYDLSLFDKNLNYKTKKAVETTEEEELDPFQEINREMKKLALQANAPFVTKNQLEQISIQYWQLAAKLLQIEPNLSPLYNEAQGLLENYKESVRRKGKEPDTARIEENLSLLRRQAVKSGGKSLRQAIQLLEDIVEASAEAYGAAFKWGSSGMLEKAPRALKEIKNPKLKALYEKFRSLESNLEVKNYHTIHSHLVEISKEIAKEVPSLAAFANWNRGLLESAKESYRRDPKFEFRPPGEFIAEYNRLFAEASDQGNKDMLEGLALVNELGEEELEYYALYLLYLKRHRS